MLGYRSSSNDETSDFHSMIESETHKRINSKSSSRIGFWSWLKFKEFFFSYNFCWNWIKFNLKWILNRTGNIDSDFEPLSIVCACARSFACAPTFSIRVFNFLSNSFFWQAKWARTKHTRVSLLLLPLINFAPFSNRFHILMLHTFPLGRRQNNHYAKAKAIDITSSSPPKNVCASTHAHSQTSK